jgi:hypothetical protein
MISVRERHRSKLSRDWPINSRFFNTLVVKAYDKRNASEALLVALGPAMNRSKAGRHRCGGGNMKRAILTIAAAALFCSVTQVHADSITYSLTTTASGTFGGSSFTNAQVTVTLTGDTSNIMPGPVPFTDVLVNTGAAKVSVFGLGTGTFTDPIAIIDTLNDPALHTIFGAPVILIVDQTTKTGILLQGGSIFSSYDLKGPFGPLSGLGGVASGEHGITPVFPTTAGNVGDRSGPTGLDLHCCRP